MASAASGAATIRQVVAATVGDESVQTVLYREERGSLNDSSTIWREYASISELPAEPLVGWEELIVFTEQCVHRWVETGYGGNPTTVTCNRRYEPTARGLVARSSSEDRTLS